jgi:hypothetical protein
MSHSTLPTVAPSVTSVLIRCHDRSGFSAILQVASTARARKLSAESTAMITARHSQIDRITIITVQEFVRIAAIALSTNSILVTHNHKDFSQVPSRAIEDWTGKALELE